MPQFLKWVVVGVGLTIATLAYSDDTVPLYLAPGGLEAAGPDGPRVFAMGDTGRTDIIAVASAAWGEPLDEYSMEECGYGEMEFAEFGSGVTLAFDGDAFIGWMTEPDAGARFENGTGAGSPVIDIETVAGPVETFESSIGHEFAADNVFGIASGPGTNATVEMLWSGVSCIFR